MVFASLGFVALGLFLTGVLDGKPKPPFPWAGWIGIAFFGPAAFILARRLFDREPQLIVDERGIYSKHWSSKAVPWNEIQRIVHASVQRQHFLCVFLTNPDRHPPETFMGQAMRANRALGFGDLAISVTGTNRSFDELCRAVSRHWPHGLGSQIG